MGAAMIHDPGLNVSPSRVIDPADDEAVAELFGALALQAGAAIMQVYARDPGARVKKDSSPVCDADILGEELILNGLSRQMPDIPVVAEELGENGVLPRLGDGPFILVDALDGTKEFLQKRDCFTVNIALIRAGAPAAGAVFAPARQELFVAGAQARRFSLAPGAAMPPLAAGQLLRARPLAENPAAVISRSHCDPQTEAFLTHLPVEAILATGSSLKFCLIAAGEADLYPRFSRTREWDIAAGDAVLRRAGGLTVDGLGQPFRYGKQAQDFVNGPFVAWGDPRAASHFPLQA